MHNTTNVYLFRANYSNIPKGIEETTEYLERFFRNALMGEENNLQSRYLLVGGAGDGITLSVDGQAAHGVVEYCPKGIDR